MFWLPKVRQNVDEVCKAGIGLGTCVNEGTVVGGNAFRGIRIILQGAGRGRDRRHMSRRGRHPSLRFVPMTAND
jgi:hypothetical protein